MGTDEEKIKNISTAEILKDIQETEVEIKRYNKEISERQDFIISLKKILKSRNIIP